MKYLCFENSREINEVNARINLRIVSFTPSIFHLYSSLEESEDKKIRKSLFRFYISLLTKGGTKIYFALDDDNNILHYSVVIPRNIKYPFLKTGEYCIGPCNTSEKARGLGIYPYVLQKILRDNPNNRFYMIIKEDNLSSIRGVKKAGFKLCEKTICTTKVLKRFVEVKEELV